MKRKLYKIWYYDGNQPTEIFRLQAQDVDSMKEYVEKNILNMDAFLEDELDLDWSNELPVWRWYEDSEDEYEPICYEISVDEIENYSPEDAQFVMINGTVYHDII